MAAWLTLLQKKRGNGFFPLEMQAVFIHETELRNLSFYIISVVDKTNSRRMQE